MREQTNSNYVQSNTSEGVIRLRLDTSELIRDVELFLKGYKLETVIDEDGRQKEQVVSSGNPLINDEGLQCVLFTFRQTINSHGVQGNWSRDYFEQFIDEADKNFSSDLMNNLHKWNVKLEKYNVICNAFMNLLQEFASRIIENKERDSYGASMQTTESVVQDRPRSGSLFGVG